MSYCRRCNKSKYGKCSLGYIKSDNQISNENFKCFSEVILKSFDTTETTDQILATKGPYGEPFSASEIDKEIKRLNRLKGSMLVGVEV